MAVSEDNDDRRLIEMANRREVAKARKRERTGCTMDRKLELADVDVAALEIINTEGGR